MKLKVLAVGIVVVLTMLACQPQFLSKPADKATGPTGPKGTIKMNISLVSAPLAKALGVVTQSTGSSSKVFLIVTKVDLRLLLEGVPTEYEMTVPVSYAPGPPPEPISWSLIPAADGYQVEAWTYNENTSEEPLLHGVSEAFSVASGGETTVVVRLTPISPIAVPTDHSSVQTSLDSCWQTSEPGEYGWGEERWFVLDATGHSAIRVNADVSDEHSGVIFLIADQEGEDRSMALSGAMNGGPVYWNFGGIASAGILTPYSTYYVGLITVSDVVGSSILSTVDVNFEPFSDDPYEENDSISTAYSVSKTVVYNCIDLDKWSPPRDGGDWYKFELTPEDGPNFSVKIDFDHDESNLDLELWQWPEGGDPNQIAISNSSTFSGPGDPVLEQELIEETLVPGTTYYICVHGYDFRNGSDYQLQWLAGTGTILIGIE